jgi:hypothetical protein
MFLAFGQLDLRVFAWVASASGVDVGTVDEIVVARGWASRKGAMLDQRSKRESGYIVPVVDRVCAKVNIVVGGRRTVNDDCADDSIRVSIYVNASLLRRELIYWSE